MANEHAETVVSVDLRLFRLVAVQKAAHRYSGHYRVRIDLISEKTVNVVFALRPATPVLGRLNLADFESDLLDQELRETIGAETQAVRNLILAQAFSNVNLLDPVGETADFEADPLNIRAPDKRPSNP